MARATATKSRTTRKAAAEAPPKRRPGRPAGSKNRTAEASVPASSREAKTRRVQNVKAAAAPKMNKAELEVHVAKLERTVARLRAQNKELKRAVIDVSEQRDVLETAQPVKPAPRSAKPRRAPVKGRRGKPGMQEPGDGETGAGPGDEGADN
jgi:hypothetical protein